MARYVIKSSGQQEPFNKNEFMRSLRKVGTNLSAASADHRRI
jgi:hypothetical protein